MVAVQHDHVVDFYEHEAEMSRRVAAYLAGGLEHGEAAIVVATPEHRSLFAGHLADQGVDVARCRSDGLLHEEDAEEVLSGIFAGGPLDSQCLHATIGALLRSAARFPGIRVVGEMVDLLWARGDVIGAISLESEWDQLAKHHDFMLYCCYNAGSMHGDEAGLARVRDLHSEVVSAPPAISWVMTRGARNFYPAATSPRAARHFVADLLRRWGLDAHVEAATVIVSELSTNGVLHAKTPFEVILSRRGAALRIAVRDASSVMPVMSEHPIDETTGRGLAIVVALARDWGIEPEPTGKTVWADLAI